MLHSIATGEKGVTVLVYCSHKILANVVGLQKLCNVRQAPWNAYVLEHEQLCLIWDNSKKHSKMNSQRGQQHYIKVVTGPAGQDKLDVTLTRDVGQAYKHFPPH